MRNKKKMHRRSAAIAWTTAALMVLSGCSRDSAQTGQTEEASNDLVTVAFSEVGAESDWRVANSESMRTTFTEENGYSFYFEDAKGKQENQITTLRNYILQDVDYIVLAPIIETGWDEVLLEAKDAGIPVIVVDRMVDVKDEDLYTAWVGSDFHKEGEVAMDWLDATLREQGRAEEPVSILHVYGTLGSSAQIGRTEGLLEAVEEHENWKILSQVPGEFTQAKTYEVVSEVLKETRDIDVIYCENDDSAFGAIEALEEAGISYGTDGDVIIISFDSSSAGLQACLEEKINLDVECNPMHGPRVEKIIQQLESGEAPEKKYYVEETYFTPENLTQEIVDDRGY